MDALLFGGTYEGSVLDTLSEQHRELQVKYSQIQSDHQALQQRYDTRIAGFEAVNKWLGEELMEVAGKNNEKVKQLQECDLVVAELQVTVEKQQKSIADAEAKIDNIYYEAFRQGSDLWWASDDYNRVLDMLCHRITGSLAGPSGTAGAPSDHDGGAPQA